jgi:hypothetical protein
VPRIITDGEKARRYLEQRSRDTRLRQRLKRGRIVTNPLFTPLSLAPVSSWFRLSQGTITGSGYSSIPDALDGANPLTQTQDNRRPPAATSANGLPIITATTPCLTLPITAARANTTTWGLWGWFRPTTAADNVLSLHTIPGSSANRTFIWWNLSGTRLSVQIFASSTTSRLLDITGLVPNTWQFLTIEFNGNRSGDARCIVTVNAAVPAQAYSTSTAVTEMPAALAAVTGTGSLMALGLSGPFYAGSWGPNFGFLGSAMPAATEGLLTPGARALLRNYQAPT